MAQLLRVLDALLEDLGLISSTYSDSVLRNSSSKGSDILFWPPLALKPWYTDMGASINQIIYIHFKDTVLLINLVQSTRAARNAADKGLY